MVTVVIGGKAVSWADAEALFAKAACTERVEFRDETGTVIATAAPVADVEPDWVRAITPEETARRMAGPFLTLEEYRRQVDRP